MKERRGLSRELKRAGSILFLLCFILAGSLFFTKDVDAATFSDTQKEYINVLSKFMIEGTVSGNLDVYRTVSQGKSGKKCMEAAAISNRAALMAEGIDFLDSNWSQYYAVETNADHIRAMTDEELLEFLEKTAGNVAMCAMLRVEPAFLSLEWLQKPKED